MQNWPFVLKCLCAKASSVQKFFYAKIFFCAKVTFVSIWPFVLMCLCVKASSVQKFSFVHIWPFVQKFPFMHIRLLPGITIFELYNHVIYVTIYTFNDSKFKKLTLTNAIFRLKNFHITIYKLCCNSSASVVQIVTNLSLYNSQ